MPKASPPETRRYWLDGGGRFAVTEPAVRRPLDSHTITYGHARDACHIVAEFKARPKAKTHSRLSCSAPRPVLAGSQATNGHTYMCLAGLSGMTGTSLPNGPPPFLIAVYEDASF